MNQIDEQCAQFLASLHDHRDLSISQGPAAVKQLLQDSSSALATIRKETGEIPMLADAFARVVQDLAASDSKASYLGACVEFWISLPAHFWVYALTHLEGNSVPFSICMPILNELPKETQLLLVHEFFRNGRSEDTHLAKWCSAHLNAATQWQFDTLLTVLSRLHYEQRSLAAQFNEHMQTDRLTEQCMAILSAPHSLQTEKAARMLSLLGEIPSPNALVNAAQTFPASTIAILLHSIQPRHSLSAAHHKALAHMIQNEKAEVRTLAFSTMIRAKTPKIEKFFLFGIKNYLQHRHLLYAACLEMDEHTLSSLLAILPEKLRNDMLLYLLAMLMETAPDVTSHAITTAGALLKKLPEQSAKQVKSFILSCRSKRYITPLEIPKFSGRKTPKQEKTGGLFRKKERPADERFQENYSSPYNSAPFAVIKEALSNHTLEGREISGLTLISCTLGNSSFENITFKDLNLCGSSLTKVQFSNCTFKASSFEAISTNNCTFTNCTFVACSFEHATLSKTALRNCSFEDADFSYAVHRTCTITECTFTASFFWGSQWERTPIQSSYFAQCTLLQSTFFGTTLCGVTSRETALAHNGFERCTITHCDFQAGTHNDNTFRQTTCSEPRLLQSAFTSRQNAVFAYCELTPAGNYQDWLRPLVPLANHVVLQALHYWQTNKRKVQFLRQNSLRIALTQRTLAGNRMDFFKLLPMLLGSRMFEKKFAPGKRWPTCSIYNYQPDAETIAIAKSIFGDDIDTAASAEADLQCDAVYTIGSVGSIAMTSDSDIDYWVCLAPDGYTQQQANRLTEKLDTISYWAEEHFSLETTFFVMGRKAIQENDFGFSSKESSGTAQALLLKEEFYRTALKVCGKELAWWALPEINDAALYAKSIKALHAMPFHAGDDLLDLGMMKRIPLEEYFGAALWQIVKALKNPFKSVMKLGLLEAYIASGKETLLCQTIKRAVHQGSKSLLETDPYVTLIRTLRDHYSVSDNESAMQLLQTAFMAKLHESGKGGDATLLTSLRRTALVDLYGPDQKVRKQSFVEAKALGQKLNDFFLSSYTTLQKQLEANNTQVRISPEDITRLGRKIFTAFAPQKDKIARLPFVNSMGRTIKEVMFKKDTTPGKQKKWLAYGLPVGKQSRKEHFVELKKEYDPVRLMAWLVSNGIYTSGMHVEVDVTMRPIAAQDISILLQALLEVFPPKALETDIEQTLKSEKITIAHCVCNMLQPRDASVHKEVSVVYLTNWGEQFCTTFAVDDSNAMQNKPLQYLEKKLPRLMTLDTAISYTLPYKSRTPRLKGV